MENKEITVSIMIPTYNQAEYIEAAINSAISQTYQHLEIIVGDDASTDGTSEIIARINNPRLKSIRNTDNLGRVGNYRNLLMNHAAGDYVINLDGDDYYIDNNFIADAVMTLKGIRNPVMLVAKVVTKSAQFELTSSLPSAKSLPGIYVLNNLPKKEYFVMHMGVLYSRKKAIDIDFYRSETTSSDWESIYRLMPQGDVVYLDKVIGVWRIHGESESNSKDIKVFIDSLSIWTSVFKTARSYGMNRLLSKYNSFQCITHCIASHAIKLSLRKNGDLCKFIRAVAAKYKTSCILIIFAPKLVIRLILIFFGYYER